MIDPQKPDPKSFWCKKCQCHGGFVSKRKSGWDEDASDWHIKLCKTCAAEGHVPKELKEEFVVLAIAVGGILLFVNAIIIAMFYQQVELANPTLILVVTSASLFFFALLLIVPRIGDISFWLKWKKWVKERDWE